nr:E3 SUMO-protein ligase SIZ1-like isoform X1 [Ipomoea batatas]
MQRWRCRCRSGVARQQQLRGSLRSRLRRASFVRQRCKSMSSSGDEQASSGGVDLRLLSAVSELRATAADDDNLELRPPSSCLDLQFRRWSDISSGGESLAAAVRQQGAISLLGRSPELQSIKDKLAYFRLKELKDVLTQLGVSKQGRK